jgi:succinylglutamic semialdehyde dehydrogenase
MSQPLVSRSPWDGAVVWSGTAADADACVAAVGAAAQAFPAWSRDQDARRAALERLAQACAAAKPRIVALLIAEAGKCRADAEAEADLLAKKVAVTLGPGLARTPQAVGGNDAHLVWRPRGVAVVLGPFNFPLHLLHGLVAPALAVGCTVVAKPSERCPALGALYAELIAQAGLAHACRVVQGGADTARALIAQPQVATVAAVGGRATGLALGRALAARPEVVLALELGGVNHALACADADLDVAAAMIADGAWKMAGQRCTATRVAHAPRPLLAALCERLQRERLRWRPDGTPAGTSGALISPEARERQRSTWTGLPAGLELVAGDPDARIGAGGCVDPLLLVVRDPALRSHPLLTEEHFGPALVVDAYDDPDECVARIAANPYRLSASVFTASRERFLALAARLPYGLVNHNRPTAGARSDLPFGGLGRSGNGRPAALAAGQIFADESVVW